MTGEEQKFEALSQAVGKASWHQLWAAVDNILNDHHPDEGVMIDCERCPVHGPGRPDPTQFVRPDKDCPTCVSGPYMGCTGWDCVDWPCTTVKAICGALGISLGDLT